MNKTSTRPISAPSSTEIAQLVTLCNQSRYEEAENLAQKMTRRFPKHGFGWKVLGVVLKLQGRTPDSLEPMLKAATLAPGDATAHSNLSDTLNDLGRLKEAETSCRRALELKPDFAEAYNNLGNILKNQERPEEAEASYRKALELKPDCPDWHYNLGRTLQDQGRMAEAEASYRHVVELKPTHANAFCSLGTLLYRLNRLEEAEAAYRKALEIKPDFPEAHCNLGNILNDLGRFPEAKASYCRALEINPDYAEAHNNLGNTFNKLGLFEKAETSYRRALELNSDYAEADNNLGNTLREMGRMEEAKACYLRALNLRPDYAEAYNNLGITLKDMSRLNEAEASFLRALELKPDYAEAYSNLGNTLKALDRLEEAEAGYLRALELRPDLADAHSNLLYLYAFTRKISPEAEHDLAIKWEKTVLSETERTAARNLALSPDAFESRLLKGGKLRVGFVSAEIGQHAVAEFLEPLLENIDRSGFQIYLYPTSPRFESRAMRIKALADELRPLFGLSDLAAANQIRADRIDVLIDTTSHMSGCRLGIFAHRAAPVQCHYIGYHGTTGLTEMDWFIADEELLPPFCDTHFSEKIWRLPRLWLAYRGDTSLPDSNWQPDQDGTIWLGSFNNLAKVREETLRLWAKTMNAIPESKLLLKGRNAEDSSMQQRIRRELASHGISDERIEFAVRIPDWHAHMALYDRLDIALDSIPLNSGTTAFDALWMGVPMVAMEGNWMGGRMTATILKALGKPEWVTRNEEEYVARVTALARDVEGRRSLRFEQRELMAQSQLCDAKGMARALEDAFESMSGKRGALFSEGKSRVAPTGDEINELVLLFNQGRYSEAEILAQDFTRLYPGDAFGWKVLGATLKTQGRTIDSLEPMQRAVLLLPEDATAHSNLGDTLNDLGHLTEAEASCRRALELKTGFAEAYNNLGNCLKNQERPEEAEASYRKALELRPDYAEAHSNLGGVLSELGRLTEAEASCRLALAIKADYAEGYCNLGKTLKDQRRLEEAEACYCTALELKFDYAPAHCHLGATLYEMGRLKEAEASYRRALELKPDYTEAHCNLGGILSDLGCLTQAEASYLRALEIKPDYAEAENNLGNTLYKLGYLGKAEACYRRALEIKPDYPEVFNNLGITLKDLNRLVEAEASYRKALELKPDYAEAFSNLGNTLQDLTQLEAAAECYRSALRINPDYASAHSNLLFSLAHNSTVDAAMLFHEHYRFGERFEASFRANYPVHTNSKNPDRTLRIGFVSGDFRNHALAFFIEPVLVHLSGCPGLSLFAYYNHYIEDTVTKRMSGYFTKWHFIVGSSDAAVDEMIRADSIDILIDLSGHTSNNRLLTFARKPAPLQASWMGYPGTTGLKGMDYYLADRYFLPEEGFWGQFTEKILSLPASAPFMPSEEAPEVNVLPALSNGYLTFGSFNRPSKLSHSVIASWAQLLRLLPSSVLVLGSIPQDGHTAMIDLFSEEGIEPERLSFKPRCSMAEYLALHHQVDICLDTFPYNGGTTTCHAIWMGVPTLTISGNTPASRQGATLLSHLGLEGFIARDTDDFLQKGLNWANDLEALALIRSALRERFSNSALARPELIAMGLARGFRIMWQRWCDGLPPAHLDLGDYQKILECSQKQELLAEKVSAPFEDEISRLLALFSQGDYVAAEALARSLTERFPEHGFGWKCLGVILKSLGQTRGSLVPMQKAALLLPEDAEAHCNLSVVLNDLERPYEAETSCRRALELKPDYLEAYNNLGHSLKKQGKMEEAEKSYRRALEINPDYAEADYNLGTTLKEMGRLAEAEGFFREALRLRPDYAHAHCNLGATLDELGHLEKAEACYRRALELNPDYLLVHSNLGGTLHKMGRMAEAEASFIRALELNPDYAEAHCNLGNTLKALDRLEEAKACYLRALELKPDLAEAYSNLLYLYAFTRIVSPEEERDLAVKWEKTVLTEAERTAAHNRALSIDAFESRPGKGRKLRIGFVSAEIGQHAVAEFLEPLLENMDRSSFKIYLYPTTPRFEPRALRIKALADELRPLFGLSDLVAANQIRADRIDVLIDTTSHMSGCRLGIFAHRAAPVQCHYIGYHGTTGLTEMDWFIADNELLPPFCDTHFREKIWRLPRLRLAYRGDTSLPNSNWQPGKDGTIWLGSFNNLAKVREATLSLWARAMNAIPGSKLLLKDKKAADLSVQQRIYRELRHHGIADERVEFIARVPDWHAHMTLYDRLDIALDPVPLNSETTAFDALWMGVPMVAIEGDWMGGRMTSTILKALGKPEWVARDEDEYVAKVALLARDINGRAILRPLQRELMAQSQLCDGKGLAQTLKGAFEAMFDHWRERAEEYQKGVAGEVTEDQDLHLTEPSPDEIREVVTLFESGRFSEAETLALDLTGRFSEHGFGWKVLGAVFKSQGRSEDALEPMQRAVLLLPEDAGAHSNLADTLNDLGRLPEAEASCRRALELKPDFAEALSNLGNNLFGQGRLDEAEAYFRRALDVKPDYPEADNNLGNTLKGLYRLEEAEASFLRALQLKPDYAQAYSNLGATYCEMGRLKIAEESCRRALEIKPDYPEAHNNLGNTLKGLYRLEEAEASFLRAIQLKPDYAQAYSNLGATYYEMDRLKIAEESYRRALEIKPDYAEAYSNLGNTLIDMARPEEAETCFRQALELKPDYAVAYSNLLYCLIHNKEVDPERLFSNYSEFGEQFEPPFLANYQQHTNSRNPDRSLRIGFVSGDFRDHALAYFIEPVLVHLSGYPQLSLHAYCNNVIEDIVTERLRGYFAQWHLVAGLSDAALDEKIRADSIDILIDLSGHTSKNRLLTFARKPAPVQASWMGFPATTGLKAMDYYLADRYFLPDKGFWAQFTEKVLFLPASAPFTPYKEAPSVNELPGINNGYITFGSFNRQNKLSHSVIVQWAQLLRALPDSGIVLGSIPQDGYDTLIYWFSQEGIKRERLSFKPRCSIAEYLALHHQVDICLDTFPYNGGTTTCHAIWMGVPTLTIAGNTPASRQGATLLSHLGLEGFVAKNAEDFVRKGENWANDLEALARIRSGLRERFSESAMGQPELIARGLERALRMMWQRWCDGLPPAQLDLSDNKT